MEYVAENGNLELTLNGVKLRKMPANNPQYGSEVVFGFHNNERLFIGCIRNMVVQGINITFREIVNPHRDTPLAETSKDLSEGCRASDPRIPNPCFHDAKCLSVVRDPGIECDCRQSYMEPFCQFCKYILHLHIYDILTVIA